MSVPCAGRPNLIFITGAPGIGKSAVARALMELLPGSVWLDGDDLWRSNPFRVDETTKRMVVENIAFVLGNFLRAGYRHAILSWVLHRQEIMDDLLGLIERAGAPAYDLHVFTLTADEGTLRRRWAADGRGEVTELALDRLTQSKGLRTLQVETARRTASDVARELARMVLEDERR